MDISTYLRNIKTLNDYVDITQEFEKKYSRSNLRLNMSTVLALKQIRSLEIVYFDKNGDNGIAIHIFRSLLLLPPSKTWGFLGKELILVLKYWFVTLRQHLVQHNNWWKFLSILLKFVKEIRTKDAIINNAIIEELSDGLLVLATHQQSNTQQRLEIIQCFNICGAESSREKRLALRNKFERYFMKLAELLSHCGDFRLQYTMLECLMRWLLPRQNLPVKKQAADAWFPTNLYSRRAVDIFLQRPWINFFKDAREFLNAQNDSNDLITSVHCRKLIIGNMELITETDKTYWLDFNIGNKNISLMLETKLIELLKTKSSMPNVLVITEDNTTSVKMLMESSLTKIELNIIDPKQVYRSESLTGLHKVRVYISPANIVEVNNSLTKIFDNKYQILMDLDKIRQSIFESPRDISQIENSEDNARFSNPIQQWRRKHSGVITRLRKPLSRLSPASTTSTSSLALLREKLSALPGCHFERVPVSVCAVPQLSNVTEVTEIDESQSFNNVSTFQFRSFGVAVKKKTGSDHTKSTSRSTVPESNNISSSNTHDENSISCLLVATIGSVDDSVINDTLERFPKDKEINTDNIVDMLVKEALESKGKENNNTKKIRHIKGNTEKKGANEDSHLTTTENIQHSVADKFNPAFVEGTSNYVTARQKNKAVDINQGGSTEMKTPNKDIKETFIDNTLAFNTQVVEDFFTQHCRENENGILIISPSLARKINETSSESSNDFYLPVNNEILPDFNFNDKEIVECLNESTDKVCEELDNYKNKQIQLHNITDEIEEAGLQSSGVNKNICISPKKYTINNKKMTPVKLNFEMTKKAVKKKNKKGPKAELKIKTVNKMSIIHEKDSILKENISNSHKNKSPDMAVVRKKRKLYSPKDEQIETIQSDPKIPESEKDNITLIELFNKTPKSKATPYKEIEQIKRSTRILNRNRTMRSQPSLSPRTIKLDDAFNNLKKTVDYNENINLVDPKQKKNLATFNFSSDSEDSDFKKKITNTGKNKVNAPRIRRYLPGKIDSEKGPRATKTNKKNTKQKKSTVEIRKEKLIDEKMREPLPEVLNTSIIIDVSKKKPDNLQPNISIVPEMEAIDEQIVEECIKKSRPKRKTKRTKKNEQLLKKGAELEVAKLEIRREKEPSVSPLPALIVEALPTYNDLEDSVVALEKLQDLCENESIGKHLEMYTKINITDDLNEVDKSSTSKSKNKKIKNRSEIDDIIEQYDEEKCAQNSSKKSNNKLDSFDKKAQSSSRYFTRNKNKRIDLPNLKIDKAMVIDDEEGSTGNYQKIFDSPTKKKLETIEKKRRSKSSRSSSSIQSNCVVHVKVNAVIEHNSSKSISTVGKSPINGHGDSDERPPSCKQLQQNLQPRDLEIEYLDDSIKDYHKTLTKGTYRLWSSKSDSDENKEVISEKEIFRNIIENSPSVPITRLSAQEISDWSGWGTGAKHRAISNNPVFCPKSPSDVSKRSRSSNKKAKSTTPEQVKNRSKIQSSISPIKLFVTKTKSTSDDSCVNKIRSIFSKSGKTTETRYALRKRQNEPVVEIESKRSKLESTVGTLSKQGDKSGEKSEVSEERGVIVTPKVSSWLKQSQEVVSSLRRENFKTHMYEENLQLIIEKLDTSLIEMHHETIRKFNQHFVELEKRLKDTSDRRNQLLECAAREVFAGTVQLIDDKLKECHDKFKDMDEQIRNNFKEQTFQLIREDASKKRLFLNLLKQDVLSSLPNKRETN